MKDALGLAICATVLVALPLAAAAQIELVFQPVADTSLYSEDGDRSNGALPQIYAGRNNQGNLRRALLRYDLSELPPGAHVTDASLRLWVWIGRNPFTPASLHRVLAEWGEAGSNSGQPGGQGAPAEPGDATWTHRLYPDQTWTAPGGDYVAAPSATWQQGGPGFYEITGAGMIADIQQWAAGAANFGWIIRGDEDTPQSAKAYDSRENEERDLRPLLTVTYSLPVTIEAETWSRVKALFD